MKVHPLCSRTGRGIHCSVSILYVNAVASKLTSGDSFLFSNCYYITLITSVLFNNIVPCSLASFFIGIEVITYMHVRSYGNDI